MKRSVSIEGLSFVFESEDVRLHRSGLPHYNVVYINVVIVSNLLLKAISIQTLNPAIESASAVLETFEFSESNDNELKDTFLPLFGDRLVSVFKGVTSSHERIGAVVEMKNCRAIVCLDVSPPGWRTENFRLELSRSFKVKQSKTISG